MYSGVKLRFNLATRFTSLSAPRSRTPGVDSTVERHNDFHDEFDNARRREELTAQCRGS
jgi:hypothetical protein